MNRKTYASILCDKGIVYRDDAGAPAIAHETLQTPRNTYDLAPQPDSIDPCTSNGHKHSASPFKHEYPAGTPRGRRDQFETLTRQLEKAHTQMKALQVAESESQTAHWEALNAVSSMREELQATNEALKVETAKFAAVTSVSRQLSAAVERQGAQAASSLAAVQAAMREYHAVMVSMDDAPCQPTPSPGAELASPHTPQAHLRGRGDGGSVGSSRGSKGIEERYLRQQVELRDHIISNLAVHVGKLDHGMKRGAAEAASLASKVAMLAMRSDSSSCSRGGSGVLSKNDIVSDQR